MLPANFTILDKNYPHPGDLAAIVKHFKNDSPVTFITSGSTGTPKSIIFTQDQIKSSCNITAHFFGLNKSATLLLGLPVSFVAGKMMVLRALNLNCKLVIAAPEANPIKNLNQKIDFAAFTPMQLNRIIDESPEKINLIKTIILGGGSVDILLKKRIFNYNSFFFETFGMTETLTHFAVKNLKLNSESFEVLPGFKIESRKDACLQIYSSHTGNVQTNDIVNIVSPNQFIWKGRKDRAINTGGVKVHPEIIEPKLLKKLKPFNFFIGPIPDKILEQSVNLFIESEPFDFQLPDELSKFEKPKKIFFIPKFCYTHSGKIDQKKTIEKCSDISNDNL